MRPILCLVTQRSLIDEEKLIEVIAAAVRGGVDRIQIREKDLDGGALYALAKKIESAARFENPAIQLIINRRVDVALAGQWHGVHLGHDGMEVLAARRLLPAGTSISIAAHSAHELDIPSQRERPDIAHLAPIWKPRSKVSSRPALGLEAITSASHYGIPILAQGGITPERAKSCIAAGAHGVAVTGEILLSKDPEATSRCFRQALDPA